MSFIDRFDKFNRSTSRLFEWIGLAGLLAMMLVTCADVIGSKLFLSPVPGSIDIVMLSQLVAISFAAASALLLGRHVRVEFFVAMFPERLQALIDCLMHLLGLIFFGLVVWRLGVYGYSLKIGTQVSATAHIPLYPFAFGISLASIPLCLVLLSQFLKSMARLVKK